MKWTDSIAVGNAHGLESTHDRDPERVEWKRGLPWLIQFLDENGIEYDERYLWN